jgi:hypothetical protein
MERDPPEQPRWMGQPSDYGDTQAAWNKDHDVKPADEPLATRPAFHPAPRKPKRGRKFWVLLSLAGLGAVLALLTLVAVVASPSFQEGYQDGSATALSSPATRAPTQSTNVPGDTKDDTTERTVPPPTEDDSTGVVGTTAVVTAEVPEGEGHVTVEKVQTSGGNLHVLIHVEAVSGQFTINPNDFFVVKADSTEETYDWFGRDPSLPGRDLRTGKQVRGWLSFENTKRDGTMLMYAPGGIGGAGADVLFEWDLA